MSFCEIVLYFLQRLRNRKFSAILRQIEYRDSVEVTLETIYISSSTNPCRFVYLLEVITTCNNHIYEYMFDASNYIVKSNPKQINILFKMWQ